MNITIYAHQILNIIVDGGVCCFNLHTRNKEKAIIEVKKSGFIQCANSDTEFYIFYNHKMYIFSILQDNKKVYFFTFNEFIT